MHTSASATALGRSEPLNTSSTPLLLVFFHLTSFIRFISTKSHSCALSFQHRLQEVCSIISYYLVIPNKYHSFKQIQYRSDHHVSHLGLGVLKKFRFVQRNLHEQQTELAPTVLFDILSLFKNQIQNIHYACHDKHSLFALCPHRYIQQAQQCSDEQHTRSGQPILSCARGSLRHSQSPGPSSICSSVHRSRRQLHRCKQRSL